MIRVVVSILFLLALSCKENSTTADKVGENTITFDLIDSLGSITMQPPKGCDTFFSWIRQNDCGKPCEEGRYRFQSTHSRIFEESGFYWVGQPEDSVKQLTIIHSRPDTLVKNNDSVTIYRCPFFRELIESEFKKENIVSATVQKIGERHFCVYNIADTNKQKGLFARRLIAFTHVSGKRLEFRYELLASKPDSTFNTFIESSIKNLNTVRIKDAM